MAVQTGSLHGLAPFVHFLFVDQKFCGKLAVQAGREHWNERKKQAAEPDRNTEE